jgi:hypothetical protein
MLTPGILDSIICVSSHDVNDGEGELPAAAGSIIRMSIATTARANGIGMNSLDPKDNWLRSAIGYTLLASGAGLIRITAERRPTRALAEQVPFRRDT